MNQDLPSSLPEHKRIEIEAIKQVIIDFVDPDMIILYGSYARGEYKDQVYMKDGIRYFYISDYDLIVITDKTKIKEYQLTDELEKRIKARPDINFFMYDIDYFNRELSTGNYFFVPVYYEGVVLYDKGNSKLIEPQPLSIEQIRKNAHEAYEFWIWNTKDFYELFESQYQKFIVGKSRSGLSAWLLFQVVESLYSAVLLVFMGIKPKLHNLNKYRKSVNSISKELNDIFPDIKDSNERRIFDLLNRAYINGKYKKEFEVSRADIDEIASRVVKMTEIVERLCLERIEKLK